MIHTSTESLIVSIILPVYNDRNGLLLCLAAISHQTFDLTRVEVIVVDNGSTLPITIEPVYSFSVRVVRHLTPGSYAARNAGVREASGDALVFLDADCWPDKDWLVNGIRSLLLGKNIHVIGGDVMIVRPSKPNGVALYQCAMGFSQESNIRDRCFSATANLFCTREQFASTGPFDERLFSGGDREWCWRAIKLGLQVSYDHAALVYTQPRTTLTAAIRQARRVAAGRLMLRELGLTHIGDSALTKDRSGWQALIWILTNRSLNIWERVRVTCVAAVIRCAVAVERARLAMGGRAERR